MRCIEAPLKVDPTTGLASTHHSSLGAGQSESGERGSASILGVGLICVLLALFGGMVTIGQTQQAATRARGVADLAALAAAQQLLSGSDASSPCVVAATVAAKNDARVTTCRVMSTSVQVEVATEAPLGRSAAGLARAGEPEP